jgi:hypothetical protein
MTEHRPGRRYLARTGRPADGSQGDSRESTQHLVNPRVQNPTSDGAVHEWIRKRAREDGQMQAAAKDAT